MVKNYLKIAFRNFRSNKVHSFINVTGLAIGITCCLLIMLYVQYELSYDNYHEKADRIFRVWEDIRMDNGTSRDFAVTGGPLAAALKNDYPEIVDAVRFWRRSGLEFRYEDRMFYENEFAFTDPNVFSVFTYPLVKGDSETALAEPSSIVISEDIAEKYFGSDDPMGKSISVNGNQATVTGVMKNVPRNSYMTFDILASMSTLGTPRILDNWHATIIHTFIEVAEGVDAGALAKKIEMVAHNYEDGAISSYGASYHHFIQPLRDLYLRSNLRFEWRATGQITYIYMSAAIALPTLLVACINFMNLSTARSVNRAKEVGLRKVVGAKRAQIINQFLGESVVLSSLALAIAVILVHLLLPEFNTLINSNITIHYSENVIYLLGILGMAVTVGLLSGSYPALYLSAFRPISVISGVFRSTGKGSNLRRGLVVVQFAVSIVLIIGTLTISRQINYMRGLYLGFDKEQTVVVNFRGQHNLQNNYEEMKHSFLEHSSILSATASASVPGRGMSNFATNILGDDNQTGQSMYYLIVDTDFIPSYNITVLAGRNFQKEISTDATQAFMINESAAKAFGFGNIEEVVGKSLRSGFGKTGEIVGVINDFNFRALQNDIEPLVISIRPSWFGFLSFKVNTNDLSETLAFAENKWKQFYPDKPFEYFFLDEDFGRLFQSEEQMGKVFSIFTTLAFIIACLGLFGLSSFTAEQRTKEIGVRKILGASTSNISVLLSKEFIKWVALSNLIAWPVAHYVMNSWLKNFAYRADIGLAIFFLAGITSLVIALLTVSYQSVKAAFVDPVNSLRYE